MHQKGQAPQEWERVDVRVLGYRTRTFIFNEGVQLSVVTLAFSPSTRGGGGRGRGKDRPPWVYLVRTTWWDAVFKKKKKEKRITRTTNPIRCAALIPTIPEAVVPGLAHQKANESLSEVWAQKSSGGPSRERCGKRPRGLTGHQTEPAHLPIGAQLHLLDP